MLVVYSHPTLCDTMDGSLPDSSVHGIPQARILEGVAIPFSRGSSQHRDQTQVSCIVGRHFTVWATREVTGMYLVYDLAAAKSLQLCPTLCDPIDGSLPGSPVPGILQARTLEWVAISFSNAWKSKVYDLKLSYSLVSWTPNLLRFSSLILPFIFLAGSSFFAWSFDGLYAYSSFCSS